MLRLQGPGRQHGQVPQDHQDVRAGARQVLVGDQVEHGAILESGIELYFADLFYLT